MRINHELINKSQLAKLIGMTPDKLNGKLKNVLKKNEDKFTVEEREAIREAYIDLFSYIFEVDYEDVEKFLNGM